MIPLVCPHCTAKLDLLDLIEQQQGRDAMMLCGQYPPELFKLTMGYLGLFRCPGKQLKWSKFYDLFSELAANVSETRLTWQRRTHSAPLPVWKAALDEVLAKQATDKLVLPLKTHGLLYAIVAALADKAEVQAEQRLENQRRSGYRPLEPKTALDKHPVNREKVKNDIEKLKRKMRMNHHESE